MRRDVSAKSLRLDRNLLSIFCCFLIIVAMWLGVCLNNSVALVGSTKEGMAVASNRAIASQPTVMDNLKNQIKSDLDEESGSVTGDLDFNNLLKEKARAVTEHPKRTFDDSVNGVEATRRLVDERTEENVANIQGKAKNSGRRFGRATRDIMSNTES